MIRRLPVRWRLTLWYAALLAATLLLFGGGLYLGLRQRLHDAFDEQLRSQATVILAAIQVEDGEPTIEPGETAELEADLFLRLLDADAEIVVDTGEELGGVPLDREVVSDALAGEIRFSSVAVTDPEDAGDHLFLRIITLPVRAEGSVVGVLELGLERDEIDEALSELLAILALALPLALIAAAAAGYLLAGRALAPVATITQLAARIGGRDLHARLGLDLPDDELGRLARTFDGMLARIEDAFERQRRFTGDAAHELRTPLSLMRSQVDLALARQRTSMEYREALHGLDTDLERMTGLVSTLLTLARADSRQLPIEREPLDLAETVATILEQYAPVAREAGVALRGETTCAPLVADEDLIIQVLVNLVDNALAHTPAGGTVKIGCGPSDGQARLWVADTGGGIPPEHQARVFDRFYRVDPGRTRERGGTGLGLAICRAIAEAHGGTIALTSTIGQGTRVEVVFPSGR